ncbi:ABC1 kinase family protein [Wenzhouxiangella marina]|uniref:2-octaprenylphenol hydroxylase of ubiquinone biosynthetic pathway n=1 Tax=Wenzhouxiangella marina TaxID=1579979 RepID=A0A0K0XWM1_9GAMM|nr:AarF/UbiB family protein [Wenzhouxiangella marina]AKS42099.1 2-octaprenylphenol hydroxylase of ubiquinone biosynthetic pathway [Wenzhouxiangella marina]MBB6086131.1 ubiquinone biosynthesis protein [Wenzhouxiangella marina]
MLWQALSAARDLGRVQDIAAVLVRYGFGDVVQRIGMAGALEGAGKVLHWKRAEELARLKPPERVRRVMEELGPTFVKLGQVLATRVDLFGPEWLSEFSQLQDKAPMVDWAEIEAQLTEDLGAPPDEIFSDVDHEPLAAASLAQVHRARLPEGDWVVLKVRRPGIRPVVEADLRLLARLAEIVESEAPELRQYRPRELVRQFTQSLRRELDFAAECRNAERIADELDEDDGIVVPGVHWQYSGERLNVQDYIEGISGRDLEGVRRAGLNAHRIAQRGSSGILRMILEHGFFHADPHPGNVKYLPGDRIALLDFGMVGRLTEERRYEVAELLHGLVDRNVRQVRSVLLEWSADSDADPDRLEEEVAEFIDQYHGVPLEQLNMSAMISDMTSVLRRNHLMLPPDLVLMLKAFITLEGMGRSLDPGFDMASEARPVVEAVLKRHYSPAAMARRAQKSLIETVRILGGLPEDLSRLLRAARRGRIEVHVDVNSLKEVSHRLDGAASRLTLGVVTAALIIGSAIALNVQPGEGGLSIFGLMGFVGAALGGVWLLLSIWRSGRED